MPGRTADSTAAANLNGEAVEASTQGVSSPGLPQILLINVEGDSRVRITEIVIVPEGLSDGFGGAGIVAEAAEELGLKPGQNFCGDGVTSGFRKL